MDLGSYVDGEAHGWARQPYGYFDPAPRPRDIIHTYSYVPTAPSGAPQMVSLSEGSAQPRSTDRHGLISGDGVVFAVLDEKPILGRLAGWEQQRVVDKDADVDPLTIVPFFAVQVGVCRALRAADLVLDDRAVLLVVQVARRLAALDRFVELAHR